MCTTAPSIEATVRCSGVGTQPMGEPAQDDQLSDDETRASPRGSCALATITTRTVLASPAGPEAADEQLRVDTRVGAEQADRQHADDRRTSTDLPDKVREPALVAASGRT